ncbi:hypothetical protein VTO42DRAFT_1633 [Malbranchea cinnamomea]
METTDMAPLLEQLDDDIDELEEVFEPLLSQALSVTAQKMPVMDKAKLYVLVTYTIESLLFSYLRLHGVNAREHPVFTELTRVKQYFEKIKKLETPPEKRTMTVDKHAVGRFIKHGLVGNDKIDLARAEREAKEKAMAQLRVAQLAKKSSIPQKRPVEESASANSDNNNVKGGEIEAEVEKMIKAEGAAKASGSETSPTASPMEDEEPPTSGKEKKAGKREKKRQKRLAKKQKKANAASASNAVE